MENSTVLQRFPCGCHINKMADDSLGITYCDIHKSAPDMYEALKVARNFLKTEGYDDDDLPIETIDKALAKANRE